MTRLAVPTRRLTVLTAITVTVITILGCGSSGSAGTTTLPSPIASADTSPLAAGLGAIDAAVKRWQSAPDLAAARRSAEEVRNLIVGPHGPSYGDADRNGTVEGASATGLLPGLGGEDALATTEAGPCVERDVLGGSWADPARRWSTLEMAIAAWSPSNNTFPALPSHPQRIVGWATLTLATTDLATAVEYGGHARLHIDVATRAVIGCAS